MFYLHFTFNSYLELTDLLGASHVLISPTIIAGADPDDVAITILDLVASGKADFVVAANLSAKIAIWLRLLAPSVLNKMLVKRYEDSR